ncbi:MAG: 50S ribosomal protein L25 [Candidatus Moranbacteria bacterium]|nr:50S ribosomal protein L25 [Candidatus Moranbacteria bacterium]
MSSKTNVLKARKRDQKKDRIKNIREKGQIPGILYGPKTKNTMLVFEKIQAKTIVENSREASINKLELEKQGDSKNVIIQDLQFDKVSNKLIHVDLYEVDMKKSIETDVPVEYIGQSPAVKNLGAILVKNVYEIRVKCLPKDLPEKITVNLEGLKEFDDIIYLKDIKIPQEVEILDNLDEVIISVSEPRTEKELEALDEAVDQDVAQVEGVKKEEETGEGEEGQEQEDKEKKDQEEKKQSTENQNESKEGQGGKA